MLVREFSARTQSEYKAPGNPSSFVRRCMTSPLQLHAPLGMCLQVVGQRTHLLLCAFTHNSLCVLSSSIWALRLIDQNTTSTENGHKSIPLTQPTSTTTGNIKTGVPLICPLSDMAQDKDNVETASRYLYRQSSHFDPLQFRAENHSLHIGIVATVLDL